MTQVTNASRRHRGLKRLEVWLPAEVEAKLAALCADSGYSRSDMVLAMIDVDYDSMIVAKTAQTSKAPSRSPGQRKS